jgi:hypothetical protein
LQENLERINCNICAKTIEMTDLSKHACTDSHLLLKFSLEKILNDMHKTQTEHKTQSVISLWNKMIEPV